MRNFVIAAVGMLAVACAPATSSTTVTSAEMPAAKESPASSVLPGAKPTGQLACRVTSIHDGTSEVYLEWKGSSATGTLRHKALSGDLSDTKLNAEHVKGAIVADDVNSNDLAVHAAMLREKNGKTFVRLGDSKSGWTACE